MWSCNPYLLKIKTCWELRIPSDTCFSLSIFSLELNKIRPSVFFTKWKKGLRLFVTLLLLSIHSRRRLRKPTFPPSFTKFLQPERIKMCCENPLQNLAAFYKYLILFPEVLLLKKLIHATPKISRRHAWNQKYHSLRPALEFCCGQSRNVYVTGNTFRTTPKHVRGPPRTYCWKQAEKIPETRWGTPEWQEILKISKRFEKCRRHPRNKVCQD